MVGEEEVAAILAESLQRIDGVGRSQVARQVLPAALDADAVAHHPAGRLILDVEIVDGRRREQYALATVYIVLLEPVGSVLLVGRTVLIVVGQEHGHHAGTLLSLILNVETHGLTFRDATVLIAGFHGVGHVDIRRSLLDEVAADDLVDIRHVEVVLDDLDATLASHRRVVPTQGDLALSLRVFGHEVAHGL